MPAGRELSRTLGIIREIIRRTGDRICRLSGGRKRIAYKGEIDLVTQFDRLSQRLIISSLKRQFPAYGILSEEEPETCRSARVRWIIDPLDGTTNYAHNLPIWAISAALEQDGEILLGAVYDPTRNEMFSAIKGRGASLNGRRISVSRTKSLDQSLLVTGFPYDIRRSRINNLKYFNRFARRAQAVRRLGSAALDLCYTACGRFDGYWELKLAPWDQAAGCLILCEAGGRISDFKGNEFTIYGREVLGTNGRIHDAMMAVLTG